jgi:hypothetical protein
MKNLALLLTTLLAVSTPLTSQADDFRCPGSKQIVSEGMNPYEVESKCGAPSGRHTINQTRKLDDGTSVTEPIGEEWTYDFGPQQFLRKLRFENGVLTKVTTAGKGTAAGASSK